jgi:arginine utilization protein RocB
MLKELLRALRTKNLPMYFLREYNLFSGVENLSYLETLADEVEEISRDIPGLKKAVKFPLL